MSNELLLIINLLVMYSGVLLFYKLFNTIGIYCWIVFATLAANIEVMILIHAFGLDQTLGNILFATTFLATDILSEVAGKKKANEAVNISILFSAFFIITSQIWLMYTPTSADWAFIHIESIFSNTPRIMFAGLVVYAIVQKLDVWLYHKIWHLSTSYSGHSRSYLWLRNNASTMISQLVNAILFTVFAFYGTFETSTLISIICSTYVVFFITSLADTPIIYLARSLKPNKLH